MRDTSCANQLDVTSAERKRNGALNVCLPSLPPPLISISCNPPVPGKTKAVPGLPLLPLSLSPRRSPGGATMWIQVRTFDGKETRTVEDLSRLTKIESLRLKIQEIFNVSPQQQRLFYRGKQVRTCFYPSPSCNSAVLDAGFGAGSSPLWCSVVSCFDRNSPIVLAQEPLVLRVPAPLEEKHDHINHITPANMQPYCIVLVRPACNKCLRRAVDMFVYIAATHKGKHRPPLPHAAAHKTHAYTPHASDLVFFFSFLTRDTCGTQKQQQQSSAVQPEHACNYPILFLHF